MANNNYQKLLRQVLKDNKYDLSDIELESVFRAYDDLFSVYRSAVKKRDLQLTDKMVFFSLFMAFFLKLEKVDREYLLKRFGEKEVAEIEGFFK